MQAGVQSRVWRARRRAVALLALLATAAPACAETLTFYAVASGKQALDEGEGGGNPFASALIDILGRPRVTLAELPGAVRALTGEKSRGFQEAEVPIIPREGAWTLVPAPAGESRVALVLVISDYSASGATSLPGASHDAARVGAALARAGFATEVVLDPDRTAMRGKLEEFAMRSAAHDIALVYSTGHGVEVDGRIHVLPGDYPLSSGNAALAGRAVPLVDLAAAPRARRLNFLFYGGCRDDPLGGPR